MVTQEPASVHYRNLQLHPETIVRKIENGELFVELVDPPPVRTVLELRDPAGTPHAVVVTGVVEVESGQGGVRGCRVRVVDHAQLQARPVGSEHLADASARGEGAPAGDVRTATGSVPVAEDAPDEPAGYGVQMAVPAPVVDPDGDPDDELDSSATNLEVGEGNGDETAEPDADAAAPSESTSRGKRRRGRRRK